MKTLALAAVVMLSAVSTATAAETDRNWSRPPTAEQRLADPDLDRYPGLTPRESNPRRHLTPAEQVRQGEPAPKSVCRSQWNGNNSITVCN